MPPRLRPKLRPLPSSSFSSSSRARTAASASLRRKYSTVITKTKTKTVPPPPPPRWIADLRERIGRCLTFGCSPAQVARAAAVVRALAAEWRNLLAGSEGFLTGGRRGLEGHKVAWGEMDSFGHVNNVTYYRYAESARMNWITNFAVREDPAHGREWAELMSPRATGLIMRSLKADFKFPMVYPDTISVYHKLRTCPAESGAEEGEDPAALTSLVLDCIVLSHQHRRPAARLEEDIVVYDYRAGRKTGAPRFVLDALRRTWALQEAELVRARTRVWALVGEVEALEKGTWDRPDAVEDMGTAAGGKR